MRIRYKKWARPELEASSFYEDNPEQYKGKWIEKFGKNQPFHLELGCGKGWFISNLVLQNPGYNYLAIDMVDAMLGIAKRNIEVLYGKKEISNIILTRFDIERIHLILDKGDNIERIYINFCNPWPKPKHKKKRLTHSKQLQKYKEFLKEGAEVHFKTDDDELFRESIKYFEESGFEILFQTNDLHHEKQLENDFKNNIITEHEKMFMEQGIKIKALIAKF